MSKVRIDQRWIGDGEPCFIIAEAGSNHNGSLQQAKQLIDVAASAGADAVKFQVFRADRLYPKNAGITDYLRIPTPIYDIIAQMEMPYDWLPRLASHCNSKGVLFLASVFDEDSADRLDPNVKAFKIASYEMTHLPLVRHISMKGKPVIISTGTATLEEVAETVKEFRRSGNDDLILMQCTAAYPAPIESLNIRAVATMKSTFGTPVGFSDHSRDPIVAPLAAVAIGANLIEKHYTLSNELPGPDHRFALEPPELRLMIQKLREAEKAMGSGEKVPHPVEEELKRFARRSVFAARDIAEGEEFSLANTVVLRSGKLPLGLAPRDYPRLLGRRAARNIRSESPIRNEDVRPAT
jgi:N-acetylneuraminate synthase